MTCVCAKVHFAGHADWFVVQSGDCKDVITGAGLTWKLVRSLIQCLNQNRNVMVKVYKLVTHFSTFKFEAGSVNTAANVLHRSVKTKTTKINNNNKNREKTNKQNLKQTHADQQIYTPK